MTKKFATLTTGFALFSMFFGSGNLVFPITVGQAFSDQIVLSTLGILLTGVLVPFLGVYGMILYEGSTTRFFSSFGTRGCFWFSLLALSLMGPFGVLARCLTVAHGSIQLLFPAASLSLTSASLCVILYFVSLKKDRILPILGGLLTPILLTCLLGLAILGLNAPTISREPPSDGLAAFQNAFLKGYQTMDLLAAFFFSNFIMIQVKNDSGINPNLKENRRMMLRACMIGALLLSAVYGVLVSLGGRFSQLLSLTPPQEMLGKMAFAALGPYAAPVVCIVVVLACMTTAIVLAFLFANFLCHDVTSKRFSEKNSLIITLLISYLVSNLDFSGIASFIGPILEFIYPALIVLTLMNICNRLFGLPSSLWPFTSCLILNSIFF